MGWCALNSWSKWGLTSLNLLSPASSIWSKDMRKHNKAFTHSSRPWTGPRSVIWSHIPPLSWLVWLSATQLLLFLFIFLSALDFALCALNLPFNPYLCSHCNKCVSNLHIWPWVPLPNFLIPRQLLLYACSRKHYVTWTSVKCSQSKEVLQLQRKF